MQKFYQRLKKRGFNPEQKRVIDLEMQMAKENNSHESADRCDRHSGRTRRYDAGSLFHGMTDPRMLLAPPRSLDDLLERDNQREKDGFPRKIRVGKMIKPGRDGSDKVVVVPTTVEEKFLHDEVRVDEEGDGDGEGGGDGDGGSGEGEEGEVIGEQPVHEEEGGGEGGAGQGEGGSHEIETDAYDLGRALTEQFELPNLQDKGKKKSLTRYTYDLTDRNRGFGQVLDKKATLKQVIKTNIALGRINKEEPIDPHDLLIVPNDRIYRILSPEKDFESQAMVFFVRDYSGSMIGKPTELVVTQHVLIYSWLTYQYENQVESRFILHDTEAKEVPDFHTYYKSKVAGGTRVASAYQLVNSIIDDEALARDYNIYIFHGTDGDDWDTNGEETLPELEKMLLSANRVGISIAENGYGVTGNSEVEKYLQGSGLLEEKPDKIRLDVMTKEADEPRLIEGIKKLIS